MIRRSPPSSQHHSAVQCGVACVRCLRELFLVLCVCVLFFHVCTCVYNSCLYSFSLWDLLASLVCSSLSCHTLFVYDYGYHAFNFICLIFLLHTLYNSALSLTLAFNLSVSQTSLTSSCPPVLCIVSTKIYYFASD